MFVLDNVPLQAYSTMKLGGVAAHMVEISNRFEAQRAVQWAQSKNLPFIVVGKGSNIIWKDEGYPGLVIVNNIKNFETYEEDSENVYVSIGAGEIWDDVVERTVNAGLSGIEALSLIPGTAGATPVQNVGAYGTEISDVLTTLEVFDIEQGGLTTLRGSDCDFGYRTSRFKTTDKDRFIITGITLHLTKTNMQPPFYASLDNYLKTHNITDYSPKNIRDAVIAIRTSKLPDPSEHPNNGSFFQNPIVPISKLQDILDIDPKIAYWEVDEKTVKLSAASLLESAGFKDFHDDQTGMSTWIGQPLVLVNEHAHSTQDLIDFKSKIVNAIKERFNVELVQEPELLPNTND